MLSLYPALQISIEAAYQDALRRISPDASAADGIRWGEFVADAILQSRSNDGSATTVVYTPGTEAGQWRPTISFGGIVLPALTPQWGSVRPFALASGRQFRPLPPPRLDSSQYAAEVNLVKAIGSLASATRTREQTQIAQFWA